jgi:hypothetical protein
MLLAVSHFSGPRQKLGRKQLDDDDDDDDSYLRPGE